MVQILVYFFTTWHLPSGADTHFSGPAFLNSSFMIIIILNINVIIIILQLPKLQKCCINTTGVESANTNVIGRHSPITRD